MLFSSRIAKIYSIYVIHGHTLGFGEISFTDLFVSSFESIELLGTPDSSVVSFVDYSFSDSTVSSTFDFSFESLLYEYYIGKYSF